MSRGYALDGERRAAERASFFELSLNSSRSSRHLTMAGGVKSFSRTQLSAWMRPCTVHIVARVSVSRHSVVSHAAHLFDEVVAKVGEVVPAEDALLVVHELQSNAVFPLAPGCPHAHRPDAPFRTSPR